MAGIIDVPQLWDARLCPDSYEPEPHLIVPQDVVAAWDEATQGPSPYITFDQVLGSFDLRKMWAMYCRPGSRGEWAVVQLWLCFTGPPVEIEVLTLGRAKELVQRAGEQFDRFAEYQRARAKAKPGRYSWPLHREELDETQN